MFDHNLAADLDKELVLEMEPVPEDNLELDMVLGEDLLDKGRDDLRRE